MLSSFQVGGYSMRNAVEADGLDWRFLPLFLDVRNSDLWKILVNSYVNNYIFR